MSGGEPVNYWLTEKHRGDNSVNIGFQHYNVVPANELLHLMMTHRPNQSRGVPWMSTAMTRLHNLGQYEEAEVVASRVSACKMGFFKPDGGEGYTGSSELNATSILRSSFSLPTNSTTASL